MQSLSGTTHGPCSLKCLRNTPRANVFRSIQPQHRRPSTATVLKASSKAEQWAKEREKAGGAVVDRPDIEADGRYARTDSSALHIHQARTSFARCIMGGEPSMQLAEAALQISAEDDAVATLSTVPFPVDSYLRRIDGVAQHVRANLSAQGLLAGGPSRPDPQRVLEVAEHAIFARPAARQASGNGTSTSYSSANSGVISLGYQAPPYGRSALPPGSVVDHPGVWEDSRDGYMHELLIRRKGHPSVLAILYAEVMSKLLAWGSVDFAITVDVQGFNGPPIGTPIPGITRDMLLCSSAAQAFPSGSTAARSDSSSSSSSSSESREGAHTASSSGSGGSTGATTPLLNTCPSDALAEMLRTLKRAYWPFGWECRPDSGNDNYEAGGSNSHGGFRAAAKVGMGEEMNAALRVVSRAAAYRLDRGIWTSPGAGDIMRCRGACERLVMLVGDENPNERRDLAVILLHCGEPGPARAELRAYMSTAYFRNEADPFDKLLCYKLMDMLRGLGKSIGEPQEVMSIATVLKMPQPEVVQAVKRPLTW